MIKYRVDRWNDLSEHEVVKETEKTITYAGISWTGKRTESRESKCSTYQEWFDTWEEAKAFLVERSEERIKMLREQLESEEGRLKKFMGMKKPQ